MTAPRLRILQVMRAPVGGLFRHVADLTRALAERGHDVGLVVDSIANDSQTEGRLQQLLPHVSLGIHRLAMPRVLGKGDLSTPWHVRQLARSLDIDVLHGHGAKGGFYARLARLAGSRAAAIYTPHGGVLHFSKQSSSGRIFHALEKGLMAQTHAIIFESAYAQRTYSALIGEPTCPTRVIYNGLTPDEFVPLVASDDAADFAFVGELRDLKGVHVLVDALAGVRRRDGSQATLIMAGEGGERAALEQRIEKHGLTGAVTLPGAAPARTIFSQGRVAVVPSFAESLPYVVLEAAAAQLPVIATNVGGIAEIFGPTSKSLVPPHDVEALRAAMQATIDDPQKAQEEMVERRQFILRHFAVSKMTDQIEAVYRDALVKA